MCTADFGFARELQSNSMAESVVGSPLYMAPELLEYKSYDAKADLWSVGIILYEMLVNDHPFLVVDNCHATNHLALRRNIQRYYERNGRLRLPAHISVSPECEELVEALLRVDPRERISFEDFFRASFLLPPLPTETTTNTTDLASSASANKQALVAEKQPEYGTLTLELAGLLVGGIFLMFYFNFISWVAYCVILPIFFADDWAAFSDEYVIVDSEYEDVGRKVLDGQNLNVELEEKLNEKPRKVTNPATTEKAAAEKAALQTGAVEVAVRPMPPAALVHVTTADGSNDKAHYVVASSPPRPVQSAEGDAHGIVGAVVDTSMPSSFQDDDDRKPAAIDVGIGGGGAMEELTTQTDNWLAGDRKEWVTDDNSLEELLGICYKSFSCGSVGLFVPTPFGDFIAFHEGCPHYYLSVESIAASKRDGR